ncbi:MAG: GNAT family N-acetyltransferase [Chloroflexi bacterium]|nr:GNAT family N-acetyltransferase [Chloroflexota bacterium]MCI0646387.1 GNAT family N-acetyltransferase [Chloroflexota bacterium]MCI0728355.1 GNAT family N-acetyltransferase [Chloroflexota bacterium]
MENIMRDFPHSFETERLTIRCPLPGDGAELNVAIVESWDELGQWLPFATGTKPTVEESEANVRRAYLKFLDREDLRLSLFLKGTNTMVGSSGLHRIDWKVPRFEIGYWVQTRFARQGYITEAVAGVTDFAFNVLGAKRVEIRCDAENVRSAAVPRRLGFVHEGTLRNESRHHLTGQLRDTMIFAKV